MTSPTDFQLLGVDGRPFRVTDEGEGPAVLLVHGGSNGPDDWRRVATQLVPRHRVLRYERFIYRTDPPPSGARAMTGEVHDVLAIAEAVGSPVVAVGHSSGAVVILEAALAKPELFAGVMLYEPPVAVTEPLGGEALCRARDAIDAGDIDSAVQIFFREIGQLPRYIVRGLKLVKPIWSRLREYGPAQIADTEAIESLGVGVDRYRAVGVPVLLLGGGVLSPSHLSTRLDALERTLPFVESRVTMRIHGHGANVSAPRKVGRIIEGFLDRVAARRRHTSNGTA